MTDDDRETDLEYLLRVGLTVEQIAKRAGRTPEIIDAELRAQRKDRP